MPQVIACIVIVIFSLVIIGVTIYFWPSGIKIKMLKDRLNQAINKLPTTHHREEFVNNYHHINDFFSRDESVFSYLWKEFTEQLIEPSAESQQKFFQNSIRPQKFFTLEALLTLNKIDLRSISSAPGILVGLGVFGTFLGLTISLMFVALSGLNDNAAEAVQTLISGSGVAFITSLVGLFCSLLFNWHSDKNISDLQHLVNKFNARLEKSLLFVTEEYLLIQHFKEIAQQGKYLENMDEKIALKIGDITQQIGKEMKEIVLKSNQNISENFLTDLTNKMTSGMGDFAQKQTENLEKNLSLLQDKLPHLIDRLADSQESNNETTKNAINSMTSSNLESQKQIHQSMLNAVQNIKSAFENSQNQNRENTKSMMTDMAKINTDHQEHINKSISTTMQNMRSEFQEITKDLKENMISTFMESSEKLKEFLENFQHINDQLLKQTELSQKRSDQIVENLHSFTSHLEKNIAKANDTVLLMKDATDNFYQTSLQHGQIIDKNKHLIQSFDTLSKDMTKVSVSITETLQKLPVFIEQIEKSNISLQNIWKDYEKRFINVDESAKALFENICEGLKSVSDQNAEYITQLFRQSTQVSNQFAQAVEELKDSIEDINS